MSAELDNKASAKKLPVASSWVVIDLTNDCIKFVYARNVGGKVVIQDIRQQQFKENADTEIVNFLVSAYKTLRIKTREAICVIPSNLFISKNVDMPSHDRQEIAKIVDLQAGRYTPYTRDEIVIDYLCTEVPDQHYTNVFLMIIHRKVVERYFELFQRAKIEISQVVAASEGMGLVYDQISGNRSQAEAIGGIHIGEESSDFVVADRGQMVFVRVIPVGVKQFQAGREAAQSDFMRELNKTMLAYQNQGIGRPIKFLAVTGLVQGLDFLEGELRGSVPYLFASNIPIKVVAYPQFFNLSNPVTKFIEANPQKSFFGLLSCVSHLPALHLDLTPKEVKLNRRFRETGKNMVGLGIVVMFIFFAISIFLGSKIYFKNLKMQRLDKQNEITFEQSRKLERLSNQSRIVKDLIETRGKPIQIYEKVTSLVGEDVYLSNLSYDKTAGIVKLTGTAESMSRVFAFVTKLEASRYFDSVKTNQTKSRKQGQADVADFEIEGVLAKEEPSQ